MVLFGKHFYTLFILLIFVSHTFSNEKRFDKITMADGLSNNTAVCLLEDHDGFLWIGTHDGLNKYDGINFEIYKHIFGDSTSLINNQVNCIIETKNQELWVGTANGLCKYDSETNRFHSFSVSEHLNPNTSFYIRSICEIQGDYLLLTKKGKIPIFILFNLILPILQIMLEKYTRIQRETFGWELPTACIQGKQITSNEFFLIILWNQNR